MRACADGFLCSSDSVGGGFVVNGALATSSSTPSSPSPTTSSAGAEQTTSDPHPADLSENIFYKQIRRADAQPDRRAGAEVPRATLADALGLHGPVLGVSGSAAGLLPESFDGGLDAPSRSSGAVEGSRRAARIPPTESAPREEKQEVSAAPAPPLPFHDAASLLALTRKHNLTIAQVVYNNELHWRSHDQVREQVNTLDDF